MVYMSIIFCNERLLSITAWVNTHFHVCINYVNVGVSKQRYTCPMQAKLWVVLICSLALTGTQWCMPMHGAHNELGYLQGRQTALATWLAKSSVRVRSKYSMCQQLLRRCGFNLRHTCTTASPYRCIEQALGQ